jgi:hypothetical protein
MSVLRNLNVLNQMRFDVPHLRLVDSAVAGDFDAVVGRLAGGGKPLVVKGFTISGTTGIPAISLQLAVADSMAINLNASASGSFLYIENDRANEVLDGATNANVTGSFVASSVNFISIDFRRQPDDTTTDLVKFKNPTTGAETSRQVPLGKTLNYRIVISTVPPSASSNYIALAKIITDASNLVTAIEDARSMFFRLGTGGDVPNQYNYFSWPQGRAEGAFAGGDKSITNLKDWVDAIETRLWEVGGGQNWYSPSADRNVEFTNYGTPAANGEYFTFNSGTGAVTWQGIRFLFDGGTGISPPTKNEVESGSGTITDGQCIYVDLDRSQNRIQGVNGLVAQIAALANLGTGSRPGSRWVIAWRVGTSLYTRNWRYPVGTLFQPATTAALGVVKLNTTAETPLAPVVPAIVTGGGIIVSATSGNTAGGLFEGFGNGNGVSGIGNGTGAGVRGSGVSNGVEGIADVFGGFFRGDSGGLYAEGMAGNAPGAEVVGHGAGAGLYANGGATGQGVTAISNTTYAVWGGTNGVASAGVHGEAAAGNGMGLSGQGFGAGAGAAATGGGSGGLGGDFTGGNNAGANGGAGVRGVGGTGAANGGAGVIGTAGGTNGNGVIGNNNGGSGYGLISTAGPIGAPNTETFKFTSTKVGVLIIPASDWTLAGAFTSGATGVLTANGLSPNVADGTMNSPHWRQGTVGVTERLVGKVNLPRGATITAVEFWVENNTGASVGPGGTILMKHHTYSGTGNPTTANILSTTLAIVNNGTNGWIATSAAPTASALEAGTTGANAAGWVTTELQFSAPASSFIRIGGMRVTYTYTTVDFMV